MGSKQHKKTLYALREGDDSFRFYQQGNATMALRVMRGKRHSHPFRQLRAHLESAACRVADESRDAHEAEQALGSEPLDSMPGFFALAAA